MKDTQIVLASGRGDYAVVNRLLLKRADVNVRCPPPLGVLNNGRAEVVGIRDDQIEVMINSKPYHILRMDLTETALQAAAGGGHDDVVRLLIEANANVHEPPARCFGRTALQAAAGGGYRYVVELLVGAGANVSEKPGDFYGRTALQAAAEGGHEDVVRLLLDRGVNVNEQPAPENGKTALQAAAARGHERLVKLLIDEKADVNALPAEKSGRTALQAAAEGGHIKVVSMLIDEGANVNAPPSKVDGRLALQAAIEGSYVGVQELLKNANAFENEWDIESTLNDRLVIAAGKGDHAVVKGLLKEGANVTARCPPYQMFNNGRVQVEYTDTEELEVAFDEWMMKAKKDLFARTALQAAADCGHKDVVELLLDAGADVNAPPAEESGRTALQAAAEGGHIALAKILIDRGAEVNAQRARRNGRTALQAAIEGWHEDIFELLIDSGASTNEDEMEFSNDDLLILAAGDGDFEKVKRLLSGTDFEVNLSSRCLPPLPKYFTLKPKAVSYSTYRRQVRPPKQEKFGYFARTALQAAAAGGHKEVAELLIANEADVVDACPAQVFGRTALQAAAEGGHKEVVELLLKHEATIGMTPAAIGGKTELQAAAAGWHDKVLKVLINAGAKVDDQKNHIGQTILHEACKAGDVPGVIMLLSQLSKVINVHAKDYFGSTPLHIAVKEGQKSVVRYLVREKKVEKEITNNAGQTPLQVALEGGFRDILGFLIQEDANTDGLEVEKLRNLLLRADSTTLDQSTIILQMGQHQNRFVKGAEPRSTGIAVLRTWELIIPSIHLYSHKCFGVLAQPATSVLPKRDDLESFVDPRIYLKGFNFPVHDEGDTVSSWGWLTFDDKSRHSAKFEKGIPTDAQVRSLKPANVILVGYISFDTFVHNPEVLNEEKGEKEEGGGLNLDSSPEKAQHFTVHTKRVEISWIMTEKQDYGSSGGTFRSVKYRGTLNMKYLLIPHHGVEFFTLFLDDIHNSWLELFREAREHLATVRDTQLENHGKFPYLTECLLDDSREWGKLRTLLQRQISKSKDLLGTFKLSELLYTELIPYDSDESDVTEQNAGGSGPQVVDSDKKGDKRRSSHTMGSIAATKGAQSYEFRVIRELSEKIGVLEKLWEKEMSYLETETMQMIELEFNLVSIYEARRSISMSVSMKRLSWISFIFLPLAFVSGLFGMNVDLLDSNPSWLIYLAFALPLMALVFLGWVAFKYIPIERWIERRLGARLGSILRPTGSPETTGKDSEPRDPIVRAHPSLVKSEPECLDRASSGHTHTYTRHNSWLSRRSKNQSIDEEKGPVPP